MTTKNFQLVHADCLTYLSFFIPDNSVDAIVTDPPYELGFMGKGWDGTGIAYNVDLWREALRVLKPGGHLLAFSGSRTYHRMACAIEDAGFEIRDQIMWIYSSGFPKSHNLDNHKGKSICGCSTGALPYAHGDTDPQTQRDLHSLLDADVSAPVDFSEGGGQILQPGLPEQSAPTDERCELRPGQDGCGESGLEGRSDDVQTEGQLQGDPLRASAGAAAADGAERRLHNGAPAGDGTVVRISADTHGGGAPRRPRSDKQPAQQPGAVAGQSQPQAARAWPLCGGCGLPVVPQGLGTALKPAHEPICVARKPLVGTVATNVLKFSTGALNIDGCRVHSDDSAGYAYTAQRLAPGADQNKTGKTHLEGVEYQGQTKDGRWPANLIHDGSDEVLTAFPDAKGQQGKVRGDEPTANGFSGAVMYGGFIGRRESCDPRIESDTSAARFFYCAKASSKDRDDGLELFEAGRHHAVRPHHDGGRETQPRKNIHPTVKPTDLMAYLCRLVTPRGGIVLDPFMGSGSTGKACMREGFQFIGVDMTAEYVDIARARISSEASK